MEQIRQTIRELKNILDTEGITDISQEAFLDAVLRVYNTEKINSSKKSEPATEKQVYFLKQLGKYKEGMTKIEAFKIIQESKKI